MSFRARLTLAVAVAVAVAVAAAAAIAYVVVERQLRGQVDGALRERATSIEQGPGVRLFPTSRPNEFFAAIPRVPLGGAPGYLQLVSARGAVARSPDEDVALPVSKRDLTAAAADAPAQLFFRDATVNGYHARVLTASLPGTGWALQVARPLNEVDHTLAQVRLLLVLITLGGIGIAGALGLLVAGAVLAPVRRLTQASEHVAATQDLSSRILVKGDDELSRLAVSFNTMLEALDRSQQSQHRLIADASHELRTPLTSLRTNIEVLALDRKMPAADREQLLADVVEQLGEMTALVSELVELARGERHESEPEEVRLDLLVDEAVARARRNRPGVTFKTELEETTINGVPGSIDRAVSNLLDNAAKWSPDGGTVEVAVAGPQVVVRDHGPGIADDDLPHVFDRFYRAANARGRPGSGLGLAIVRQVAESHGGEVVAERPQSGGTRMRLRLEAAGNPAPLRGGHDDFRR